MGLLDEVLSLEGALDRAGEKYDRLLEKRRELARLTAAEGARPAVAAGERLPSEPGVPPGGAPVAPSPGGVPPTALDRGQRGTGGSSAGGESGSGRGRLGAAVGARNRPGQFRARSYLENACERTTFEGVPRPGNPFAELQKDYVSVEGWTCPDGSEYYDPESFEKYLTKRSATSQRGSKGTRPDPFADSPKGPVDRSRPVNYAGSVPLFGGYGYNASTATGASVSTSVGPTSLSGDARAIVGALGDLRREVVDTLRRPTSGVEVRFQGGR